MRRSLHTVSCGPATDPYLLTSEASFHTSVTPPDLIMFNDTTPQQN